MVTSQAVQEVIFNFTQRVFIGEKNKGKLNMSKERGLFDFLSGGELTQIQAHQMSINHQKLLYELLTQYILFLSMNPELPFPEDFLDESDETKLGKQLLQYVCEYRWPFPQQLKKRRS
ncbi:hypothetical protein [Pseudoalteromonas rubra]|uniref:hypothetical protein n=1 Tax=Pseudoalteromonas rubra TaxID=43658 RepID=UPI000F7B241F|nr:hypothetical protein [Pseudoalteromonas rubra]